MKKHIILLWIPLLAAAVSGGEFLNKSRQLFLGYSIGSDSIFENQNGVPDGQSGVTALARGVDGNVYGGTSATENRSPYVFLFKKSSNLVTAVKALDSKIKGQRRINNALVAGGDGYIYGGTSNYDDVVWQSLNERVNEKYAGGRLFRFKEGGSLEIEDLCGVPAKEGVRTMASDPSRMKIYGLTEPSYKFFVYDLKQKKVNVRSDAELLNAKENSYMNRLQVRLGRALAVDRDGKVWGSAYGSRLFCYDPARDKLEVTGVIFPFSLGHDDINGVSAFALAPDGMIYGGTHTDGILFKFDPASKKVWNLGKPGMAPCIRSLTVTKNGSVVGVLGQKGMPAHVFRYADGSFEVVGEIRTHVLRADYNWYASDLDPSVYLPEGMVLFGNAGRIGKLVSYYGN